MCTTGNSYINLHKIFDDVGKLAKKHGIFIMRSAFTDDIQYKINGQYKTSQDWNDVLQDLQQLEV